MSKAIVVANDGTWSYLRDDGSFDIPSTPSWTVLEVFEPDYDHELFDLVLDPVQSMDKVSYSLVAKSTDQQQQVIKKRLTNAVQVHLDSKAQLLGYDNIFTACTYANSTNPKFKDEGNTLLAWRDNVWVHCYQVLNDVENGNRDIPTAEQLINELPMFGG